MSALALVRVALTGGLVVLAFVAGASTAEVRHARQSAGFVSPPDNTVFPAGTKTVPFAWRLALPADCDADHPIVGTGYSIGPVGSPFHERPARGLFGSDDAEDGALEVSGTTMLAWPGEYTMFARGSCVSEAGSRIAFETPRTSFLVKARSSALKIRSPRQIHVIRRKGIDLILTCGANCRRASFVATLGGKVIGTVKRSAPAGRPSPFLPARAQRRLMLKLTKSGKAKLAKLKSARIRVTARVALRDGETQVVAARARFR